MRINFYIYVLHVEQRINSHKQNKKFNSHKQNRISRAQFQM